jgi:hypothetical protein
MARFISLSAPMTLRALEGVASAATGGISFIQASKGNHTYRIPGTEAARRLAALGEREKGIVVYPTGKKVPGCPEAHTIFENNEIGLMVVWYKEPMRFEF